MCIHNTHVLGVQFFGDSSGTYMGFKFAWQWIAILAFLSQQHGLINSDQDKLYDLLRHKMSERRLKDIALHWVTEGVVGKVSSDTRLVSCNITWWRHQMETFSALLVFCAGNSPVTGEFPAQRPEAWNLCFLWCVPEATVEQTMERPVIWDATALIMTSLSWTNHTSTNITGANLEIKIKNVIRLLW